MSDQIVVICTRCEDDPTPAKVPGSAIVACGACECEVWLAPSSQRLIEGRDNVDIRCVHCGVQDIANDPDPIGFRAPGSLTELLEYLRVSGTDTSDPLVALLLAQGLPPEVEPDA